VRLAALAIITWASFAAQQSVARAAPGEVETGAGWEVALPPPQPWNEPVRGPRFARVTLDVWIAFGQPQAAAAAQAARRAVEHPQNRDAREVVHLLVQGPPGSDLAAEAALEAAAQGRFFAFVDRALADRGLVFTAAELLRAGREAGLDGERLAEALETRRHRAAVLELDRRARALGHGAGELLVNGARLTPYASDEQLFAQLADARRRAQALLDEGVPLSRVYDRLMEAPPEAAPAREPAPRKRIAVDVQGAPSRGPSLAPVTVVVFGNFFCTACDQSAQLVDRLRAAHPGQVREVWKNFFSDRALYSQEPYAAEMAVAAAAQGCFWALHDLAFASGAARARMLRHELERMARDAGCDPARAQRDQRQDLVRPIVDRDVAEGRRLGLVYTPAMLVNGVLYQTPPPFERLERQVQEELGRSLLDRLQSP